MAKQLHHCKNPECGKVLKRSDFISLRICGACMKFEKKHGRPRTKADMRTFVRRSGACANPECGRALDAHARNGFCRPCYVFQKNHGRARTKADMRTKQPPCCDNCKRPAKRRRNGHIALRKRLCDGCYAHLKKNGTHRPLHKVRPFCRNCEEQEAQGESGLCPTCRLYEKRTGRPRPPHLFAEDPRCIVCRRPNVKTGNFRNGRCHTCAGYYLKHGHDRPKSRIKKLYPFGWCDCGQVAVMKVEVKAGQLYYNTDIKEKMIEYALCVECAKAEAAIRRD